MRMRLMRWLGSIASLSVVGSAGATVGILLSPVHRAGFFLVGIFFLLVSTFVLIAQTRLLLRHVHELLSAMDRLIAIQGAALERGLDGGGGPPGVESEMGQ
jgi:hypothetical protein